MCRESLIMAPANPLPANPYVGHGCPCTHGIAKSKMLKARVWVNIGNPLNGLKVEKSHRV